MLNIPAGYKLVPIEPTDEMETAAEDDYEQRGETFPDWKAKYRAMLVAAPTPPAATQDEPITVTIEPESRGVSVGVWQGSRCIYTGAHAVPVAQGDAQDERSATHGMTLGERIAHVGGRTNAQGYIEFGSPMAVNALIQHVLRDIDCTRQDDADAYQARYRVPGGQWSSWGHVVCGVKGHEQELRYLPGERRPAPAAGDALDAKRYRWARDNIQPDHDMPGGFWLSDEGGESWDRTIDAAIAAQQGKGGM